jgi:hypothetical protein
MNMIMFAFMLDMQESPDAPINAHGLSSRWSKLPGAFPSQRPEPELTRSPSSD